MNFASVRVITDDVNRLVDFYETVTRISAVRYTPEFAELHLPAVTLAIGHSDTVELFGSGSAHPADNHSLIVEFLTDDVDAEYERLQDRDFEWVQAPTTMPWGNRSILLRDPTGTSSTSSNQSQPTRSPGSTKAKTELETRLSISKEDIAMHAALAGASTPEAAHHGVNVNGTDLHFVEGGSP